MVGQVSPGINTSEIDLTTIVPAVSTTVGAIAGVFRWGPANQRVLVDSEATLVRIFGKPNANNYETFFTAANFLAYGNALQVVRTVEKSTGNAYNAFANSTGAATANVVQIDNLDSFNTTTISNTAIDFVAKYEGALGNSIKLSICDNANVYSSVVNVSGSINQNVYTIISGSNTIQLAVTMTTNAVAVGNVNTIINSFKVGDYIVVGNSTIGTQYMKISALPANVTSSTANASNFTVTANISLANMYNGAIAYSSNNVTRYWEFYNAVSKAPGTTNFMNVNGYGTVADELHAVVVDYNGLFTGNPGQILEVFSGMSRAVDAKTDQGGTNYYKNILNNGSAYVWVANYETNRTASTGGYSNTALNLYTNVGAYTANTLPYTQVFVNGFDGAAESNCSLATLTNGYNLFLNKADVDVSLVLQGKARSGTPDNGVTPSSNTTSYNGLANYIITNICEVRKDCVLFVSPSYSDVVTTGYTSVTDPTTNVIAFRNNMTFNSSYAVLDSGYKYQYDKYNDLYRWVPLNGDVAGTCVITDLLRDPWFSPAGLTRGGIKNVVKLAYNPNQAQRDSLYVKDVNPVVSLPGQGTLLYGDKTLIGRPSAFDRINVRRLFIVIEKAISLAAQSSLFEFNDSFTQTQFKNLIDPYLRTIQGRRGITDYRVVCDSSNNPPAVVDANQFVGDIYIKPARSINFIQLNFVAVRTGVDFTTVVGQF